MSEWNDFDFEDQHQQPKPGGSGSLSWGMALTAFLSVAAVSFLVAYLTRYTEENPARPSWVLAICFSAPVAALMLSVFLKEKIHPTMTPSSSRKYQLLLALASVLLAAVVGAMCHVTNEEAHISSRTVQKEVKTQKEVPVQKQVKVQKQEVREGWSDVMIILDKSGSMKIGDNPPDPPCTQAVTDLVNMMDDDAQVALLLDYQWNGNQPTYYIDFAPLAANRAAIREKAAIEPSGLTDFTKALQYACKMVESRKSSGRDLAIIYLTDGGDSLLVSDFVDRLKAKNVKFYYIYVGNSYSKDMDALAKQTGGKGIDATKLDHLKEDMREITRTEVIETVEVMETVEVTEMVEVTETVEETVLVYSDALRDINKSPKAMAVTGGLLLVLGLLIGFTLTIMFSLQGQKRFQLVLSPLMAILAFLLLVFGDKVIPEEGRRWILEGIAFSLLGIVLMKSNIGSISLQRKTETSPTASAVEDVGEW
jgi:energy-converting hydrogenase Eha subunit A